MLSEHRKSEQYASEATLLSARGDSTGAVYLYRLAARAEEQALALVRDDQVRTRNVLSVSLAALLFKAREYAEAERTIARLLEDGRLLPWARNELSEMLEMVVQKQDCAVGLSKAESV